MISLGLAACGSDEVAGPTDAELLAAIEGRTLSPAEVGLKLETADLLCGLDPGVLQAIWDELEPEQFDFQAFVFNHRCPNRGSEFLRGRAAAIAANTTTTNTTIRRTTTTVRPTTTTIETSILSDSSTSSSSTTSTTRLTTTTRPTTTTTIRPTTTTRPTTTARVTTTTRSSTTPTTPTTAP